MWTVILQYPDIVREIEGAVNEKDLWVVMLQSKRQRKVVGFAFCHVEDRRKRRSTTARSTVQTCNRHVCTLMLSGLWVPGPLFVKIRVMTENRHRKKITNQRKRKWIWKLHENESSCRLVRHVQFKHVVPRVTRGDTHAERETHTEKDTHRKRHAQRERHRERERGTDDSYNWQSGVVGVVILYRAGFYSTFLVDIPGLIVNRRNIRCNDNSS